MRLCAFALKTLLEAIPQSELHKARSSLDRRITTKVYRRLLVTGVDRDPKAASARIKVPHRLIVEEVKNLPTDLQGMSFAPGHLERLAEANVGAHDSDIPEDVPFT